MPTSVYEHSDGISSDTDEGFTIAFEAMKDLVLSRAWSKKDYDDMTTKVEGIRSSIIKNCHIPLLARQPALTEDIFLKLLDNPSDESAFMGLSLYDLLTMDIE
ncbi:MAG: hypothetical protein MJZ15_03320 [Bacteroidales bacterium]|nr:hypothetical protein [Bacteroidales bacterium]